MKAYIDTSVIISTYKPNEASHKASVRIANFNTLTKIGSYILITELFSVISRLYKASEIKVSASAEKILSRLPMKEKAYALINAIILDWNLLFPNIGFEIEQMRLMDFALPMPEALLEACKIAPLVGLKTLDLMHIACAKTINESTHDLMYFITLDQDILNSRKTINEIAEFQPLTPQEFVDLTSKSELTKT